MRQFFESLAQALTSAPLWIQAPIVLAVAVPLCAVLALVWLRLIDYLGDHAVRAFSRRSAKVGELGPTAGARSEQSREEES